MNDDGTEMHPRGFRTEPTHMVRKSCSPQEIAAWRYEQIKEATVEGVGRRERKQILRRLREKSVQWPSGKTKPIPRSTFYRWLRPYTSTATGIDPGSARISDPLVRCAHEFDPVDGVVVLRYQ